MDNQVKTSNNTECIKIFTDAKNKIDGYYYKSEDGNESISKVEVEEVQLHDDEILILMRSSRRKIYSTTLSVWDEKVIDDRLQSLGEKIL